MNIETKWLEDFLSLAQTQSFSRSAEERHMTQPAFSRRIKALEAALGCELLVRPQVPVQLSAEGRLFQVTARSLLSQLKDCIIHLQSLNRHATNVIDFAISHTLSLSLFPAFLQSLHEELSELCTRQLVANVDDSVQALKNGICDFLLAFEDATLDSAQFQKLDLQTEELIPVCKADDQGNPLFNLDNLTKEALPYLGYPETIYLGRCVRRLLHNPPRQIELQLAFESPLADSLKVMAMQGMGIAWVPTFAIREELRQGFLTPCGGPNWRTPLKVCIYRCTRALSPIAEALWQILEARYGAIAVTTANAD